jgi:glycosyltransferase involved in cell wall biosynthesis
MAETPLATVVITTHNRPELGRRAVRSALEQTIRNIEVVVVDDASAPPFERAAEDDRVRIIRREHPGGMCAARNAGLLAARGAWITFLDDDDEMVPDMLERSLEAARRSPLPPPVAVMPAMTVVGPDGEVVDTCRPPTLQRGEHYLLERRGDLRAKNGLVMPTDVVRAIGGFDERFQVFEADDFGLRLNGAASIVGLDAALYRMTAHDEPRLTGRRLMLALDMARTLTKHREKFRMHRTAHAHYMGTTGVYYLRAGRWGAALRWCSRAVARDPRRPRLWLFAAAALAGPVALTASRRLRGERESSSGTSWATLTRRRLRKYSRRLFAYPRTVLAIPPASVTSALIRRTDWSRAASPTGAVLLMSVYRQRNAGVLGRLVLDAVTHDWDVRLWALDRPDPLLASVTVGVGPGRKFPLLNQLVQGEDLDGFDWVVVVDDDFVLRRGSLGLLLAIAERAGMDLVQPAHTELSYRTHDITVRRPLAIARRTSFVEIGPAFAVRQPWISKVIPFPSDHEMGWGLELDWSDLAHEGAQLGIVDAVSMRHLAAVGGGYHKNREGDALGHRLRARGLGSFADVQQTLGIWRPWQREALWLRGAGST